MLRKTILILLAVMFASFSVHARVYIGAGLGSDTVDYKQGAHVFQLDNFDAVDKTHLSGTGVFGTLFIGYERFYHPYYLAAELNGNVSTTEFRSSNAEFIHSTISNTHYKINNSFAISLLPGIQLMTPNSVLYARLGYANAYFKVNTTDISLANISNHRNGFRYGLGLKQAISDRFAIRLDYSRVDYKRVKFSTLDILSTTTKKTFIAPHQQLVELAVSYYLDTNEKIGIK